MTEARDRALAEVPHKVSEKDVATCWSSHQLAPDNSALEPPSTLYFTIIIGVWGSRQKNIYSWQRNIKAAGRFSLYTLLGYVLLLLAILLVLLQAGTTDSQISLTMIWSEREWNSQDRSSSFPYLNLENWSCHWAGSREWWVPEKLRRWRVPFSIYFFLSNASKTSNIISAHIWKRLACLEACLFLFSTWGAYTSIFFIWTCLQWTISL